MLSCKKSYLYLDTQIGKLKHVMNQVATLIDLLMLEYTHYGKW